MHFLQQSWGKLCDVVKALLLGDIPVKPQEFDVHRCIVIAIVGFPTPLALNGSDAGVQLPPSIAAGVADLTGGIKAAALDEDDIFFDAFLFQDFKKLPKEDKC